MKAIVHKADKDPSCALGVADKKLSRQGLCKGPIGRLRKLAEKNAQLSDSASNRGDCLGHCSLFHFET